MQFDALKAGWPEFAPTSNAMIVGITPQPKHRVVAWGGSPDGRLRMYECACGFTFEIDVRRIAIDATFVCSIASLLEERFAEHVAQAAP